MSQPSDTLQYIAMGVGLVAIYAIVYFITPPPSRTKAMVILTIVVGIAMAGGFTVARLGKR